MLKEGYYSYAIAEFDKALELNPSRDDSYFNLGACYEKLGELEEALKNYELELSVDPDDQDVPFRMGRVYLKMERYEDALASLDKAIRMGKDGSRTHVYRGEALEALGSVARAKGAYVEAIQRDAANNDAIRALARIRDQLKTQKQQVTPTD